jgi:hypothetical protein
MMQKDPFTNIRRVMVPQGQGLMAAPDSRLPFGKLYDMLMLRSLAVIYARPWP